MMLLHQRQRKDMGSHEDLDCIAWGVSPVSRHPVDGFLRMPSPTEGQEWMNFIDWRGSGKFDVADLVYVIKNLFPACPSTIRDLLQSRTTDACTGMVSRADVECSVLPFLVSLSATGTPTTTMNEHLPEQEEEAREGQHVWLQQPIGKVIVGLNALIPSTNDELCALRATSSAACAVAHLILVQTYCTFIRQHLSHAKLIAGLTMLCEIALKGDSSAARVAIHFLSHRDADVREAALRLISAASSRGDFRSVQAIIPRLADAEVSIRPVAKRALQTVAARGHRRCVHAATLLLRQDSPALKRAVLTAFTVLTECGDSLAIDSTSSLLADEDESVRIMACNTMPLLTPSGHSQAICALLPCLHDVDNQVQIAAFRALPSIAQKGDKRVVREMITVLKRVRSHCTATVDSRGQLPLVCLLECGVSVLGEFAQNDTQALTLCRSCETNSHPTVTSAAKRAVRQLSDLESPPRGRRESTMWSISNFLRCGRRSTRGSDAGNRASPA